jgi:vacuolar-type H+-ATPase subunit H
VLAIPQNQRRETDGGFMSRDSILKIRETEQKAEQLVEDARARARAMVEAAERDGRALCERTEQELLAQNLEMRAELRERTEQAAANAAEEARKEAEQIRKDSFLNKRSAEKIVIRGLMSKCR